MDEITFANKNAFVRSITNELKNIDKADVLVNDLLTIFEKDDEYDKYKKYSDLLFLLYLDKISQKLYDKSAEGDMRPLVTKLEYSNSNKDGYFDKIFKALSLFIWRIIGKPNWNIIVKIDAHNSPTAPSIYSLVSSFKSGRPELCNISDSNISKAYSLFFQYNNFCDQNLEKNQIFTVHRDLSEKKTIRSITYEIKKDGKFVRFFDGITDKEENTGKEIATEIGERYYLDFLECVLKDDSSNGDSDFYGFYKEFAEGKKWRTPSSFSFLNLGLSGFESWGTLMIEAFEDGSNSGGSANDVNNFFYQVQNIDSEKREREDTKPLSIIKSTISALKKVDDEYNEALNKERIKQESIRSSKAAIMSRNMSHNLGSHVMAYLKQKLASVTDILRTDNNVLYNLYPKQINNLKTDEIELPFLVGLGRFIGYLQERQDYVATISTDYIPYGAPVNLKDAIYDEINPDLRYMRHHDDGNRNRPFNILLNYIAKSEGLSRENMGRDENGNIYTNKEDEFKTQNDILFGFAKYYGKEGKHVFGLNNRTDSTDEALTLMRGINFSLPGGLVGRQAIFSIFENLIRNAAKHGRSSNGDNLEFTLDVIDGLDIKNNNVCQLESRICDKTWVDAYSSSSDISDLYVLSITDNRPSDKKLIKKIQLALYEPFVDSFGGMTTANKGIKEIRISAAWLRGNTEESDYMRYADAFKENKFNKKAPLVAVEQDEEGHLRYMICIRKNHSVAVIMEGMNGEDKSFFESFSRNINSCDWSFFKDANSFINEHDNSFSYIVVANNDVQNTIRPHSSNRVCIWSVLDSERTELENDINGKKTLRKILQIFTGISDNSPAINIWDGKTTNSPTSKGCFYKIIVSSRDSNINEAQYVYRTHHANEKEFGEYWEAKHVGDYRNIKFVEGITGDNSSDRLVRREPLDEKWYYSHLYAMKKQIAIIDERLFRVVHNIDENSFVTGNQYITEAVSRIKNNEDIGLVKQYLYEKHVFSYGDKVTLSRLKTKEEILAFIKDYGRRFNEVVSNNYLTAVYAEKGVDIFTVIPDENGDMAIIGCVSSDYSADTIYENTFKKIAVFTKKENNISLVSCEPKFASKYDYISIHQGILDKVYEYYGIKEYSPTDTRNDEYKLEVTSEVNRLLSNNPSICKEFIPRFIIHSGRAKPTKEDMPQKFPFIQYAAIENAVKDSKFSLVELLDFARYE